MAWRQPHEPLPALPPAALWTPVIGLPPQLPQPPAATPLLRVLRTSRPAAEAPPIVDGSLLAPSAERFATTDLAAAPLDEFTITAPTPLLLDGLIFHTVQPSGLAQPGTRERTDSLIPLYVTYGILQAADAHSTLRGLNQGAREQNPFLGSIVKRPAVLIPVKIGSSLATIYLVEKLRRKNPAAAVAVMAGVNTAYAVIVQHNYRVVRSQKGR